MLLRLERGIRAPLWVFNVVDVFFSKRHYNKRPRNQNAFFFEKVRFFRYIHKTSKIISLFFLYR